uniref:Uncharacterized protein n=1 Tax=Anopheles christyi TaxID=43041 RepID=A0A182K304_9DIPT
MPWKLLRGIFCLCFRKRLDESEEHETVEEPTHESTTPAVMFKRPVSRNIDIPAPHWSIVGYRTEREMSMLTTRTLREMEAKAIMRKNKSRRRAYEPTCVERMQVIEVQLPNQNENIREEPSGITPKDDLHTFSYF